MAGIFYGSPAIFYFKISVFSPRHDRRYHSMKDHTAGPEFQVSPQSFGDQ